MQIFNTVVALKTCFTLTGAGEGAGSGLDASIVTWLYFINVVFCSVVLLVCVVMLRLSMQGWCYETGWSSLVI